MEILTRRLLWLDDARDPNEHDWLVFSPITRPFEVIWVKNFYQFRDWIKRNGLPTAICFDHDLGSEHYKIEFTTEAWEEYYMMKDREMTGYDAAKWLCEYCLNHNLPFPIYNVQSANSIGRANIGAYIENFKRFTSGSSSTD